MITIGCVRDSPAASLPSSRIDAPLRPAWSTLLDPSLAVKFPLDTSRHRADSESNSHPGLRSHIALMRGLTSPIADAGWHCQTTPHSPPRDC